MHPTDRRLKPQERQSPPEIAARRALGDWWRIRDSNPGPADYDSVALTN